MIYLLIGISIVILGYVVLKPFMKKSNPPLDITSTDDETSTENIITSFLREIEFKALEYSIENNWPKTLSGNNLDKTILVSAGYFFSLSNLNEITLDYDEILSLASYAIKLKPIEKTIVGGNNKDNRQTFFIVLYKLALSFKEKGIPISLDGDSSFLKEVSSFNDLNIRETLQMSDGTERIPIEHELLIKNLMTRYPKWIELEFK